MKRNKIIASPHVDHRKIFVILNKHGANILHTLCNSLFDSSNQRALMALVLCARNIRRKPSDWFLFLFGKVHFEKLFNSPTNTSPMYLNTFCEPWVLVTKMTKDHCFRRPMTHTFCGSVLTVLQMMADLI